MSRPAFEFGGAEREHALALLERCAAPDEALARIERLVARARASSQRAADPRRQLAALAATAGRLGQQLADLDPFVAAALRELQVSRDRLRELAATCGHVNAAATKAAASLETNPPGRPPETRLEWFVRDLAGICSEAGILPSKYDAGAFEALAAIAIHAAGWRRAGIHDLIRRMLP